MTIKSYVRMGKQRKFFRNTFDEIEAMEQIEGLKVPSDGGFLANYNDRNGMKEMEEEEKKIDDEMRIEAKNKEEPDKNEAELLPPPEVLKEPDVMSRHRLAKTEEAKK